MSALTDAREAYATRLEGLGIKVRESPSEGHVAPPAAIVTPAPNWLVVNRQMGGTILHSRLGLRVILLTGKVAAGSSLKDLEDLLEMVALDAAQGQWVIGEVAGPGALNIAGTEYLSATLTLTQQLTISAP